MLWARGRDFRREMPPPRLDPGWNLEIAVSCNLAGLLRASVVAFRGEAGEGGWRGGWGEAGKEGGGKVGKRLGRRLRRLWRRQGEESAADS